MSADPCIRTFRLKSLSICQVSGVHKIGTDALVLGSWATLRGARRLLDAGTGTGILALMALRREARLQADAIDTHPRAVSLARQNARLNGLENRMQVFRADIRRWDPPRDYDAIWSNPPYFDALPSGNAGRNAARQGGREFLAALWHLAARHLTPQGHISILWPADRRRELLEWAYDAGFFLQREWIFRHSATTPYKRLVTEWSRRPLRRYTRGQLTLYGPDGRPTPEFSRLAAEFLPF